MYVFVQANLRVTIRQIAKKDKEKTWTINHNLILNKGGDHCITWEWCVKFMMCQPNISLERLTRNPSTFRVVDRRKSGNDNTVGGGGVYPIADLKVMLEGMKWWAGLSDDVFFLWSTLTSLEISV